MMDGQTIRFIREEIRRQVNVILWGESQGNQDDSSEDVGKLYGSMPTMSKRPLVEPYGFHARAPKSTIQCVGRSGEHPGSRMVLGHLDQNRPTIDDGEVIIYNQFGQQIYLEDGKIHIGSKKSSEPLVLGKVFQSMMSTVLSAIASHTHLGNLGFPTGVPLNALTFTQQNVSPVTDGLILSDTSFTEK